MSVNCVVYFYSEARERAFFSCKYTNKSLLNFILHVLEDAFSPRHLSSLNILHCDMYIQRIPF